MWEVDRGGGTSMVTRSALTRSCCCSCRRAVQLLRRTRDWDMKTVNTHLIPTWPAEHSYVVSRTAEQCFFVFSEPENHHQAETEADPELGPGADATLWYRSREGIVRGQWPDSVDYVTVLNSIIWLAWEMIIIGFNIYFNWEMCKDPSVWLEECSFKESLMLFQQMYAILTQFTVWK